MESKILSNTFSTKGRVISLLVGLVLVVGMSYLYLQLYNKVFLESSNEISDYFIFMGLAIEGIVFGALLIGMNLNIKSNAVRAVALVLIGVLGTLLYYEETIRVGMIILFAVIVIFVFFVLVLELNTTVITMSLFSVLPIIIISVGVRFLPTYEIAIIYSTFTLYIVLYTLLGVYLNRFVISKVFGYSNRADDYTREVLKAHIYLIYLVVFIIINITGGIYGNDNILYNIVNNCFLTVIVINSIDFKKIKIAFN